MEDEVYDEEDEAEESASGIGRGMGAARETVGGEGRGACERGRRGLLAGVRGEEDGGAGGDMVVAILWGGWKDRMVVDQSSPLDAFLGKDLLQPPAQRLLVSQIKGRLSRDPLAEEIPR